MLLSGVNVDPYSTEKLKTDYNQNFLEVAFIGLNFMAPDQLYYRYKLIGLEEQWQQTKNTSLRYPSLSSGDYIFQVQAVNSNGLISEELAQIINTCAKFLGVSSEFLIKQGVIWLVNKD